MGVLIFSYSLLFLCVFLSCIFFLSFVLSFILSFFSSQRYCRTVRTAPFGTLMVRRRWTWQTRRPTWSLRASTRRRSCWRLLVQETQTSSWLCSLPSMLTAMLAMAERYSSFIGGRDGNVFFDCRKVANG